MKENLKKQFNDMIQEASDKELEVLQHLYNGLQKKEHHTYINKILQIEEQLNDHSFQITIPLTDLVKNPLDILHGGVTATIIDNAMAGIIRSVLPTGTSFVTTQLNIHYILPGIGDSVTCKARIDHQGKQTMVLSADVIRGDGKKIAQASGSFFIIGKK